MSYHSETSKRILVVDDNPAIHEDFRKILCPYPENDADLAQSKEALFGSTAALTRRLSYHIDSAFQGQQGLAMLQQARAEQRPYAMAFIDVRMPPGWDGIETVDRIWAEDLDVQTVICTAYSDYSWSKMHKKLGHSDRLVILKKPFDNIEVLQLANALSEKWRMARQARRHLENLQQNVDQLSRDLQSHPAQHLVGDKQSTATNEYAVAQRAEDGALAGEPQLGAPPVATWWP